MELYLDNAATTPLDDEVREAMAPYLAERFGNPSSRHPAGGRAAEALDEARERVARALGARPERVVFTSGGTEANNLAVLGLARAAAARGRHVVLGATEHPSVRDAARALADEGFEVEVAGLGEDGLPDLADWEARLRADTVLAALMLANNEVGTVHPVRELVELARARSPRAKVHTDAVQAFGKLDVRMAELGVDSLSVSAHKVHGPKGAGALVLAPGASPRPLVFGGGQEGGLRSGTENVAGIVGLGVAAERAHELRPAARAAMAEARRAFLDALAGADGVRPLAAGGGEHLLPNIASVRVTGAPAEVYLHHLETRGVLVSAGSACQEKKRVPSPALLALGLSAEEARSVLRVSFSKRTTPEEARAAARVLAEVALELGAPAR